MLWVYLDPPTNTTRVHDGACRFCNHGQGLHGLAGGETSQWLGPFASPAAAAAAARETGKQIVQDCRVCGGSGRLGG